MGVRGIRFISLPVHGLVELVVGLSLVVLAIGVDLGTAGALLTFTAGVIVAGAGLGAADTLSLTAHRSLDRTLTLLLALASMGAASAESPTAAAALLVAAVIQLTLTGVTRWSRVPVTH